MYTLALTRDQPLAHAIVGPGEGPGAGRHEEDFEGRGQNRCPLVVRA